jgi:hypothetical protein
MPAIVALLASRVESRLREGYLCSCVASIAAQTVSPSTTIIGLCGSRALQARDSVMRTFNADAPERLRVLTVDGVLSQFQMYARLLQEVPEALSQGDVWLAFSDDDDLWDECRVALYERALSTAPPVHLSQTACVCVPTLARNVREETPDMPLTALLRSPVHVRAGIARGAVTVATREHLGPPDEYVCYLVRRTLLADFLREYAAYLEDVDVIDVLFSRYVRTYERMPHTLFAFNNDATRPNFMYFYRQHATSMSVRPANGSKLTLPLAMRRNIDASVVSAAGRDLHDEEQLQRVLDTCRVYCSNNFLMACQQGFSADAAARLLHELALARLQMWWNRQPPPFIRDGIVALTGYFRRAEARRACGRANTARARGW